MGFYCIREKQVDSDEPKLFVLQKCHHFCNRCFSPSYIILFSLVVVWFLNIVTIFSGTTRGSQKDCRGKKTNWETEEKVWARISETGEKTVLLEEVWVQFCAKFNSPVPVVLIAVGVKAMCHQNTHCFFITNEPIVSLSIDKIFKT